MRKLLLILGVQFITLTSTTGQIDTAYVDDKMYIVDFSKEKFWKGDSMSFNIENSIYKQGIKIYEFMYLDTTLSRLVRNGWYDDGTIKYQHYFDANKQNTLSKYWDEKGNLVTRENVVNGDLFIIEAYYENKQTKNISYFKYKDYEYNKIEIKDTVKNQLWKQIDMNPVKWFCTTYIEYYPNGNTKSIGDFAPLIFEIYDLSSNEIVSRNEKCKKGEWTYFNEDGTIKEIVYYKDCIRQQGE